MITRRKANKQLNPLQTGQSTTEQPTIEQKSSAITTIEVPPKQFSTSIGSILPDKLSTSITVKNPKNIYRIKPLDTDKGFNEIAWQDQDGSKLYLQNLNSSGVIDERLKVTYEQVQRLAKKSRWTNSLPDTIFVNLKSAGTDMSRMEAMSRLATKKMVLALLDSYRNDPQLQMQRGFKLPNKLILKEETMTDNPNNGESVITFSVKGITQIEPIMGLGTYMQSYSQLFSDNLLGALKTYQDKLKVGVVNGFRVEQVAKMRGAQEKAQASRMVNEIGIAAQSLQETIDTEIAKTKKNPDLTKILKKLQEQVVLAIKDDFNNEFDTRRWQQWLTPKTLTEDNIVPGTGKEIGSGAQGPVFKYQLDPALGRSPVVLKYDNNGLNQEALGAGLPELNPQQSVRAVAASKISNKLGLVVIPQTDFFVGTDADGRPKLGQAMDVVNGTVGQRKAGIKNDAITGEDAQHLNDLNNIMMGKVSPTGEKPTEAQRQSAYDELLKLNCYYDPANQIWYPTKPIDQNEIQAIQAAQAIVNNPDNHTPQDLAKAQQTLDKYVPVEGQWYRPKIVPVDINYGNPVVQQGLSDLQVFDCIIGHADRNAGNWIYEKQGNTITGVKGIDNDDTFGKDWSPMKPQTTGEWSSKTPGVPPIVDISTARNILKADFNTDIRPLLADLSDEEIKIAANRFDQVQQEVGQRVKSGKIASMGDDAAGDQAKLGEIRNIMRVIGPIPAILRWGDQTAGVHTEQNSYLGSQIAQKNLQGVAPESGDGLVLLPA